MRVAGIICEYNPIHNGHVYHIEETKKAGASHIIAVMSGNYVQRGETAIIDKHTRASLAVENGADLVVELPIPFCTASANVFAKAAVYILDSLGIVDFLSFGSECGDVSVLEKAVEVSQLTKNNDDFKKLMSEGYSYPQAHQMIIEGIKDNVVSDIFRNPNNTLAIEYINALKQFNSKIEPFTVKREKVSHDSKQTEGEYASASLIRDKIYKNDTHDISSFMPQDCFDELKKSVNEGKISDIKNLEKIIFYKLMIMSVQELSLLPDSTVALAQRIYSAVRTTYSIEDLFLSVKTKCFTLARIRRVIIYALLGIKSEDFNHLPQYARILAFNDKGCELLSKIKEKSKIPVSTSLSLLSSKSIFAERLAMLDEFASDLYNMSYKNTFNRQSEFSIKITKM